GTGTTPRRTCAPRDSAARPHRHPALPVARRPIRAHQLRCRARLVRRRMGHRGPAPPDHRAGQPPRRVPRRSRMARLPRVRGADRPRRGAPPPHRGRPPWLTAGTGRSSLSGTARYHPRLPPTPKAPPCGGPELGTSAAGSPRWTTPATGSAQKPHGQAPTSSGSGSTSPGRSASSPGPTPVADGRYRALLAERDRPVPPPPTPYPEGPSLWWARAQENTDDAEDRVPRHRDHRPRRRAA